MEGKIAVFGDSDFVMPYSAIGLATFAVGTDAKERTETAQKLLAGQYAMIIVSEPVAIDVENIFKNVQGKTVPLIVTVPFTQESSGYALGMLGKVLRAATGIDIINENKTNP